MGRNRLDKANIQLGKELWAIKSSLDIYMLIGFNVKTINMISERGFLAFVRYQSLVTVALGLAKVFEREEGTSKLCSVTGIYRLAKAKPEQIQDIAAARTFVHKYGIANSEDWTRDVDQVFAKLRLLVRRHMKDIDRIRNTQLAHLQQNAPTNGLLPSIAAFEELLAFAFEFHAFVNAAFLNVVAHPILIDRQIASSLLHLLKKIGVSDPISKFDDM